MIDTITASRITGYERKTSYEANRDVITQVRNNVGSTPTTISQCLAKGVIPYIAIFKKKGQEDI